MKISVIHPARNENDEIIPTVNSMLHAGANEVLVYDDGSDVPLQVQEGTRHFHHQSSLGPSVCRNLGANTATGDVLVFADAHTRINDLRALCAEAVNRNCIMVPAMQSLYGDSKTIGYGRNFVLKGQGNEVIDFDLSNTRPEKRYTLCGGNWGGFFIMPRSIFIRIGGWVNHSSWGHNDASLILKAWFCNVPTILDRDTIYKHKGKVKSFGYPVTAVQPLLNLLHTYFVIFEEQTFQNHWLPLFELHKRWMLAQGLEHIAKPEVQAERIAFQRLKLRTDDEFFSTWIPEKGYNGKECNVSRQSVVQEAEIPRPPPTRN